MIGVESDAANLGPSSLEKIGAEETDGEHLHFGGVMAL